MHNIIAKLKEETVSDGSSVFHIELCDADNDDEIITTLDVVDEEIGEGLIDTLMIDTMNVERG